MALQPVQQEFAAPGAGLAAYDDDRVASVAAKAYARIADAFGCRIQTVESLRKRLVTDGFDIALNGKPRESPPRKKVLDGKQEAKVIAMRLGKPPKGYANWSLRLLADRVVELGLVDSISHETVRQTLKKTA